MPAIKCSCGTWNNDSAKYCRNCGCNHSLDLHKQKVAESAKKRGAIIIVIVYYLILIVYYLILIAIITGIIMIFHCCPVKVSKSVFEIVET